MAGFKLTTDVPAKRTYVMARRAAHKLKFALEDKGDRAFEATKGSYWLSLLFGSYNIYCQFQLAVEEVAGRTEVYLARNKPPKRLGKTGVERLRSKAKELTNGIITEILAANGKVLEEKEY